MLRINYHTHTKRCGHAIDEDIDYVEASLSIGIKELGFADHISFPDLSFPEMRQDRSMLKDYLGSLTYLKERYKDRMEIHIGFEAEYIPQYVEDYQDLLQNQGIEYLLLGQHCQVKDGKQVFYHQRKDKEEALRFYTEDILSGMRTGLFTYVAHPDYFLNFYQKWDSLSREASLRIIETAKELDLPLEVNVAGQRYAFYKHRFNSKGFLIENLYPYPEFWNLVREYGAKTIIGIDAHSKKDILDKTEEETKAFCLTHGLSPLDHLDLKKIHR